MKKLFVLLGCCVVLISCNKDESTNSEANLISFELSESCACNEAIEQVSLDFDYNQIHIFTKTDQKTNDFPVHVKPDVTVSAGASVSPKSSEEISFSNIDDIVEYTILSEDKSVTSTWYARTRNRQLPGADFEVWHDATGMEGPFKSPGHDEHTTIWATANVGTSTYGVYGTVPLEDGDNTLVKIITGETVAVPVTAGTLYTGRFDLQGAIANPTDPEKATDFGIPFIYRPTALKVWMSYQSGDQVLQGELKNPGNLFGGFNVEEIAGVDTFKIYGYLEKVTEMDTLLIASVELEGSNTPTSELQEVTIPFIYESDEVPNQISLIFTSSANGHYWRGAVGSTLLIDDITLTYE